MKEWSLKLVRVCHIGPQTLKKSTEVVHWLCYVFLLFVQFEK
jgi:hypothetical protein